MLLRIYLAQVWGCFKIGQPKNHRFLPWKSPYQTFQNKFWETCTPLLRVFGTTQAPNSAMSRKKNIAHPEKTKSVPGDFRLYLQSSLQNNQTFDVYPTPPNQSNLCCQLTSSALSAWSTHSGGKPRKWLGCCFWRGVFSANFRSFCPRFGFIGH